MIEAFAGISAGDFNIRERRQHHHQMPDFDLNIGRGQHGDVGRGNQIEEQLASACFQSVFCKGLNAYKLLRGASFFLFLPVFFHHRLYLHSKYCCVEIKYRTAYRRKSRIVVSSIRIVRNPKHMAAAAGMKNPSCTSAATESSAAIHKIVKSRSPHSHRFAAAFRFCG